MAAATAPSLLAFNVAPSPTFLNQALAIGLWAGFVCACASTSRLRQALRAVAAPMAALALMAAAALMSNLIGSLPASLTLSALAMIALAMLMLLSGAAAPRHGLLLRDAPGFVAFNIGWVVAGVLNAVVAAVQVFAPEWTDGDWIATSALAGRAVGNLRQPNHLSSLLLWSTIALIALFELRLLARAVVVALMAMLVFAVVLTASRTGVVGVALLALWGLADRRLSRSARGLLLATPLLYAASWLLMSAWADAAAHTFGGQQRLAEGDLSASRFGIWADTLALIRAQPWTGVGFGEFNFAWSLSVMPQRPGAFFDHAHNLPLHLAAELGLPLAAAVMALLLWGLVAAWRRSAQRVADEAIAGRCATAMLVLIGLHSLLEYPLWYAYFLLPAAWAWGCALAPASAETAAPGAPHSTQARQSARRAASLLVAAGAAAVIAAALSVLDYARMQRIFSTADGAAPLTERIADGQRSPLFAHHAHYAAATVAEAPATAMASFDIAAHFLLDTRLMTAWAQAHADAGDLARAQHLAARLREFRNPQSEAFFAPCAAASAPQGDSLFQCQAVAAPAALATTASAPLAWRDFVPAQE